MVFVCTVTQKSLRTEAAIAQLGERQTEDLKVPGSIPGLGILFFSASHSESLGELQASILNNFPKKY